MVNSQSTVNPLNSSLKHVKRDGAIDATLDAVDTSLKLLDMAADFLPVAGVGTVVLILRSMVEQIRNTRMNSKTAIDLENDILDLAKSIDDIVQQVKERVGPITQSLSNDQRTRKNSGQKNKPGLFQKVVDRLHEDLEALPVEIQKAQEGNWFSRLFRNGDIKSRLEEVKVKFARAKENFQRNQLTIVAATVEELTAIVSAVNELTAVVVPAMEEITTVVVPAVKELRAVVPFVDNIHTMGVVTSSKIDDYKYDDDLRALPYVNANYKAVGESGYLPGTRMELILDIQDFSNAPVTATSKNVYLLRGAAGTGKSTVAREVCHRLEAENRLGASFFFVRSDAGDTGSTRAVFPTIAYQLAALQPAFRPYIAKAARDYMKFQSGSPTEQLQTLIMKPLKSFQDENSTARTSPIVIVLDAMDEAGGDLGSFFKSLKELVDAQSQFRVFITTRPEQSITFALREGGIYGAEKQADMEDIPREAVDSDIRHFLERGFRTLQWQDKLLSTHPNSVEVLTEKAERLFIYARTVINHLDHKVREVSLRRLTDIIDGATGKVGLSALDALYAAVLQNAYDAEAMEEDDVRARVNAVLAGLVVLQDQVTIKVLAPLMGVTEDAAVSTVEELRSIISCSGRDLRKDVIRPLHLTLREFLVDIKRCKNIGFFVDRRLYHTKVAEMCLRIMNEELRRDMCQLGDATKFSTNNLELIIQERVSAHILYACIFWSAHITESEPSAEMHMLLERFCNEKLLAWIEMMSLTNRLHLGVQVLLAMYSWAKKRADYEYISKVLYDGYRFVATFFEPINSSPGQIYSSGLSFAPDCTLMRLYAKEMKSNCLISPRDTTWGSCLHALSREYSGGAKFSRDGRLLATYDSYGGVEIRDAMTLELRKTLEHAADIVSADFHPNSLSLVSLSKDGTMEEWDWLADTHHTYGSLEEDRISDAWMDHSEVAYNADATKIISYRQSINAVVVWSTGDQSRPLLRIPTLSMIVKALSSDANGKLMGVLVSPKDKSVVVKFWKISTGEEEKSLRIPYATECAVFSTNNIILVAGHKDKICVWNLDGDCSTPTKTITSGRGYPDAIALTQSGDVIAAGFSDLVIRFWDVHSGAQLAAFRGLVGYIRSLQFSPQDDRIVSKSGGGTIRIWDTRKEALSLDSTSGNTRALHTMVFSPHGEYIAAVAGNDILLWDSRKGSFITTFSRRTSTSDIVALSFSPDASLLASFSSKDGVLLWDIGNQGSPPKTLSQSAVEGSHYSVRLVFNATGNLLSVIRVQSKSYGNDLSCFVKIWDVAKCKDDDKTEIGVEIFQSQFEGNSPHYIRFSPQEPLAFVRYFDSRYGRSDSQIITLDRASGDVEKCDYNDDDHPTLKPILDVPFREQWVNSTKPWKHLLWLPENRIASPYSAKFAVHGDLLAIGSATGILSLVDMSRLKES